MPLCGYADGLHELQNTDTGGGIGYDGVQYSVWGYALACLFLPLFVEVAIENQQVPRIAHTENDWAMRISVLRIITKKHLLTWR